MCSTVAVFQGPGFSRSKLFRVQVFSRFNFSGLEHNVQVQVLEVAYLYYITQHKIVYCFKSSGSL